MTVTMEQARHAGRAARTIRARPVEACFSYNVEGEPCSSPSLSDADEHPISSGAVAVFIPAVETHR